MIYLDNAATTQVSQPVLDAMLPYFTEVYGNAGSIHTMGLNAAQAIKKAREQCALPINANPDDIIFTSGGSEANTLAIVGLAKYLKSIGKTHLITTQVEHPSVLEAMKYLFHNGFTITYLPVLPTGELRLDSLKKAIQHDTGLVSVMGVNNEIGNEFNLKGIGAICRQNGVLFHTDCVQAYCNINIDVEEFNIDFLSVSGHKFHAPKGVGFLYARNKDILEPIVFGGGQEFGLRSGTENTPYIVGLGAAASIAYENFYISRRKYKTLMEVFAGTLIEEVPDALLNGLPHYYSRILNVRFEGVDGETLLLLLNSKGVYVSAGSACSAHSIIPSHVLMSLQLSESEARSSIRVSFSENLSSEEVANAARIIGGSVKELRRS